VPNDINLPLGDDPGERHKIREQRLNVLREVVKENKGKDTPEARENLKRVQETLREIMKSITDESERRKMKETQPKVPKDPKQQLPFEKEFNKDQFRALIAKVKLKKKMKEK
jgi:hypothetical protein